MKIEEPHWFINFNAKGAQHKGLEDWFRENVTPVNEMLSEGMEVFACNTQEGWHLSAINPTDKALVICVKEIKKESAEDVLRDYVAFIDSKDAGPQVIDDIRERARACLVEK